MSPKARKRQKTKDTLSIEVDYPSEKHRMLANWAIKRGIEVNNVKPAELPGRGIGLVATKSIKEGQRIIFVPEKAMIKPDPDALNHVVHRSINKEESPQAHLTATLMLEALKGSESDWYEICQSVWPQQGDFDVCMLCSEDHQLNPLFEDVIPPSIKAPLDRLFKDLESDLGSARISIESKYERDNEFVPHQSDRFKASGLYHWMIANTRSFHWKPTGRKEGAMVICPYLDYMNHCPEGKGCKVTQSDKGYELTANRNYESGEEILAAYGAHPNDKLLVHYGFVLPSEANSDDEIRLDHVILPRLSQAQQDMLRDVGYLGGYGLIPVDNDICFKTQVAVRSVLLTSNEWEHYMGSGEDLASNKDAEVKRWLEPSMQQYLQEVNEGVRRLRVKKHNHQGALHSKLDLLERRWVQIRDAVQAYLDDGAGG